ncbi:hypothetical protein [Kitasatospora paranensis]|uniref:Uncharacterized protein n=1 Tax=Kitasatospora paranensis TaxID=258053 RepID=A0ABW2G3K5_9ACTN
MPLPDPLTARMAQPDFWPLYAFDDDAAGADEFSDASAQEEDEEDEEDTHRAEFGLGGGLALVLDIDLTGRAHDLALRAPGLPEPVQLGWDDEAHFQPHVMRWAELELLARAVALHDPDLRHPGPVLALLARFVVLDEQADPDAFTPPMDAAFRLLRPETGRGTDRNVRPEVRDWFELRDLRGTGLEWTVDAAGHHAVDQPLDARGAPLYSTRTPGSEEFPFAAWSALLDRAERLLADAAADPALSRPAVRSALERCLTADGHRRVAALADALRTAGFAHPALLRALTAPVSRAESCWAVEVLAGAVQGSLVRRWFGVSPLTGAQCWTLYLTVQAVEHRAGRARRLAADLDAALRQAGLGRASANGSAYRTGPDGELVAVSDSVQVLVRDDLARGVALTAEALRRHEATDGARLRHYAAPYEAIRLPWEHA